MIWYDMICVRPEFMPNHVRFEIKWKVNVTYVYVLGGKVQILTFGNVLCFHQGTFAMNQRLVECHS